MFWGNGQCPKPFGPNGQLDHPSQKQADNYMGAPPLSKFSGGMFATFSNLMLPSTRDNPESHYGVYSTKTTKTTFHVDYSNEPHLPHYEVAKILVGPTTSNSNPTPEQSHGIFYAFSEFHGLR